MKKIKFRGWMPTQKAMVYEISVAGKEITNLDTFFSDTAKDGFVWMQFTGLLDKFGKEIYESDYLGDGDEIYYQVVWDERDFVLGWRLKSVNGDGLNYTFEEVMDPEKRTVIGDIYQNPELNN